MEHNWRANPNEPDMQTVYSYATQKLLRTIQMHANSPRKYDRDGSIDRSAIRVAALDLLDGHDYTLSHGRRDEHERPFLYPGHPRLAVGHRLRVLRRLSWHKHGVLRCGLLSRRKGTPRLGWVWGGGAGLVASGLWRQDCADCAMAGQNAWRPSKERQRKIWPARPARGANLEIEHPP